MAAKMGAAAGAVGAFARLVLALRDGERRPAVLAIEAGLGASLGLIAAAAIELAVGDPSPLLIAGAAGAAGATGMRFLDLMTLWVRRKLGVGD